MPGISGAGYYGFKVIGTLKLLSGLLAVAAGVGATRFLAHDPGPRLERISGHLGLDPQNHVIHAVISSLTGIDRTHLRAIAAGTFFYALLHIVEGIGLLLERPWAGYLVVIATGSLVPFEIYEIGARPTLLKIALFLLNLVIVIYLVITLKKEHVKRNQRDIGV
jgi:uncharacterized membrane protein (DUF2068 family)